MYFFGHRDTPQEVEPILYAVISKRNRWMAEQADYVVTYVKHSTGGAAQFKEFAKKRGKIILDLAK